MERLSSGPAFEIYLAVSKNENGALEPATLKISKSCKASTLQNEAKILRHLGNDAFSSMLGADFRGTHPYLALEYIEGASIEDLIASQISRGPNIELAIHIGSQIASALADLEKPREFDTGEHGGIIHGDIHPKNLMLTLKGRVKLIDFACAKIQNPAGSSDLNAQVTNWRYTSPGRVRDLKADVRDDIFGLGMILWELCTAKRYWGVMNNTQIAEGLREFKAKDPGVENREIPHELRKIILRCLESEYFAGYGDAADLFSELNAIRRQGARAIQLETILQERLPLVAKRIEVRRREIKGAPSAVPAGGGWIRSFRKIFFR
jgi:serine/threonine protein kinase